MSLLARRLLFAAVALAVLAAAISNAGIVTQSGPRFFGSSSSSDWHIDDPENSVITMEIASPRAGVSGSYRPYKAYPGILYEVPVSVVGGSPPFECRIVSGPPGMTLGKNLPSDYLTAGPGDYCILRYTPSASGVPYDVEVSLEVEDQLGTVVDTSYTITVTTSGFLFVDSISGSRSSANGGSGTGTIDNPFLGIRDWYAGSTGGTGSNTKTDSTHQGKFVYYRAGTYALNDAYLETSGTRLTTTNVKPTVHMGYPGETANLSFAGAIWNNESQPIWISNFTWVDTGEWPASNNAQHYRWGGGQDDFMAFKNVISDVTSTASQSGSNASIFFTVVAGGVGSYHVVSHNTFGDVRGHDSWLMYHVDKGVFEWNTHIGPIGGANGHGVYHKDTVRNVSSRFNLFLNSSNATHCFRFDGYSTGGFGVTGNEIIFNACRTSGDALLYGFETPGTNYERRNTFYSGNPFRDTDDGSCTIYTSNNVVRYSGSLNSGSTCTINGAATNLAATSGLIDTSTLLLTGTDRTNYLNIKGHEISFP